VFMLRSSPSVRSRLGYARTSVDGVMDGAAVYVYVVMFVNVLHVVCYDVD
jgi:hypothetical protein